MSLSHSSREVGLDEDVFSGHQLHLLSTGGFVPVPFSSSVIQSFE